VATIEIPREVDRFVLYFDTPRRDVNAYALATALIGLADAVREANAAVNPGYSVEVVVEALSDGSFQAVVRTLFEKAKNLFSHEAVKAIVYGIIATHIYEVAIKAEKQPTVVVSAESVVIESGKDKIIVPRTVYDAKKLLEKSERFGSALDQVFRGATADSDVAGIGLKTSPDPSPPPIYVPREKFALLTLGASLTRAFGRSSSLQTLRSLEQSSRAGTGNGSFFGVASRSLPRLLILGSTIVSSRMTLRSPPAMSCALPFALHNSEIRTLASL